MTESELTAPGGFRGFEWVGDASGRGHHDGSSQGWAHHGIAVSSKGEVVTFSEARPVVQFLDAAHRIVRSWEAPVVAGHSLRTYGGGADERLWIADNGDVAVRQLDGAYEYEPAEGTVLRGSVVELTMDGEEIRRFDSPDHPAYAGGSFSPTDMVVDEVELGGSGDIWIADGYGQHLVHRFDRHGAYLATLSGEPGAGHFLEPHALHIDRRSATPELWVADRGNSRIQVFDLAGLFLRAVGTGRRVSPGGFAAFGTYLIVAELDARITVLDREDRIVQTIGAQDGADRSRQGWPNTTGRDGRPVRPDLRAGAFNTPHGIAIDSQGNLLVTEWLIGGRIDVLRPL